jgi:hypothetical protein
MPRIRIALTSAALLAAPIALAPSAHASCTTTTKVMTGRIAGEDGRFVDAMLGFDIMDSAGRHLDGRSGSANYGCAGYHGYGQLLRVNRDLPAAGSTTSGTKDWKVVLPGNTAFVHIEVYPRAAGDGGTDESRYGHALRRKVRVPYGQNVNIRLPLVCAAGGKTGAINGWATQNGVRVQADRVAAWSLATDTNTMTPILGWNVGYTRSNGYFAVPNLPSGQTYTVQVSRAGKTLQPYNIRVDACKNTYLAAKF